MRNLLRTIILILPPLALQGCAALWVADKAVDTAVFAGRATAKVGVAAAEVTWDAGSAIAGAATGEDGSRNVPERPNRLDVEAGSATPDTEDGEDD